MNNVVNQVAFLRTSRDFPEDLEQLSIECDRSYIDIAGAVNARTIGIFPTNRPAITGESWFVKNNQRQQTFRRVYPFTGPVPAPIPHGINTTTIAGFTKIYGTFTDGTNWYPLPYVTTTMAVGSQVSVFVTPTNIVITAGGGGAQPVIVSGWCVLEWMSQF